MFWVIVVIIGLALMLLKYIGILVLIILVIAGIYALFKFTKTKITESNDNRLKTKKEKIIAELSEEIKWRKEVFEEIDGFFSKRKKSILFLQLITDCSGTTSVLERYEEIENESFVALRNSVLSKQNKHRHYDFPENISEIGKFVNARKQEIKEFKKALSSVASADSDKLNEIAESFCKEITQAQTKKRKKITTIILTTIILFVTLIVVLSNSFAVMMAENYHKSVLNENLKNLGYEHLIIKDIEYKKHTSYYDDDNEFNFYTTKVLINCDVPYKDCFVKDMQNETNKIYNKMDVDITYTWAGQYLSFNNDDNYEVVVIDASGKEINIKVSH